MTKAERARAEELAEKIDALTEIKEQIKDLAHDALELLDGHPGTRDRAYGYWYAHILGALDKDNEFLGGSFMTMQDSINELEGSDEDSDD